MALCLLILNGQPGYGQAGPRRPACVAPALDQPTAATTPRSLGPFVVSSHDGKSHLRFGLASQFRLKYESLDRGEGEDRTGDLYMEIRRLRLILALDLQDPDLSFKLQLSTAPQSLELMDLFTDWRPRLTLQLRCGQFKVPFTRYRIQSFARLTFVDWSIVTRYFGAERQLGWALHNGYENPPQMGYVFGVFTGANARAAHAVGLPGLYGEPTLNPSDLTDPGTTGPLHPELFWHLSCHSRGTRIQTDSDEERSDLRYGAALSAAWDLDPVRYRDHRLRLASEGLVKHRGLSASVAGYAGYATIGTPARTRLAMTGALAQAAYRLGSTYEVSARYAVVDFTDALIADVASRTAAEVRAAGFASDRVGSVAAEARSMATPFALDQTDDVSVREEELTVGLNIYLAGQHLKWQHDVGWLRHSRITHTRNDILARSQFQLTF